MTYGTPKRVQVRQHGVEVLLGDIGQVVEQHRRVGRHRPHLGSFVVEHPQRVDLGAPSGLLVEIELKQEVLQQFPVLRAAAVVAQRGDLQPEPVQAQRAETGVGDGDHLGVQRRVVDADRLDADLLQLAIAAGLRAFVAEKRPRVTQLHRQRAAVQAVFDHRAHHPGGALRPQRHRAVAAVGERVHLLGHHVGGFADAAGEQGGVLEDGQLDVAVAGPAGGGEQPVAHRDELRRIRREVVRYPLGPRKRRELRHRLRPSRNGLRRRSAPMVVELPCPGSTTVLSSSTKSLSTIERQQVAAAAAEQVGAADRALEQRVAGEHHVVSRRCSPAGPGRRPIRGCAPACGRR